MFTPSSLQPEHEDLLAALVEAQRCLPRDQREKFLLSRTMSSTRVVHPSWPRERQVYHGDFEELARLGLLSVTFGTRGTPNYDITSAGFAYYAAMKRRQGEASGRVEAETHRHLDSDRFQRAYPVAHRKWSEAEDLLWGDDSEGHLTTIGHLCREAIQAFATTLVERYQPTDANTDKAKDINRIKVVLDQQADRLGTRELGLLEALLSYWRAVSGLVQRQEHGSQPGASPLRWEDARRVVFQCAVVMFEVDRSLSRAT